MSLLYLLLLQQLHAVVELGHLLHATAFLRASRMLLSSFNKSLFFYKSCLCVFSRRCRLSGRMRATEFTFRLFTFKDSRTRNSVWCSRSLSESTGTAQRACITHTHTHSLSHFVHTHTHTEWKIIHKKWRDTWGCCKVLFVWLPTLLNSNVIFEELYTSTSSLSHINTHTHAQ